MASITTRPNGHRWVTFTGPNGKRQTVRLGKASRSQAAAVKDRIERLLAARLMNQAPDPATAAWVGGLGLELHARLAAAGLVDGRQVATLAQLTDDFLAGLAVEDTTRRNVGKVVKNLLEFFGPSRRIEQIVEADAREFRAWLGLRGGKSGDSLAPTTVSRRVRRAKQILNHAVKRRWLVVNPFRDEKGWNEVNRDRDFLVDEALIERVLAESASREFRGIATLARYGGLRCPSEIVPLTWEQVIWATDTLVVKSPKTKRHKEQGQRAIPLFPELRAALMGLWDATEDGQPLVFPAHQITGAGLSNELERACRACGVPLWPKPWQNMRATRETELLEEFPLHVVVAWLGHSPTVSRRHYAQVTQEHLARAVKLGKSALHSTQQPDDLKRNRKRRTAPPASAAAPYGAQKPKKQGSTRRRAP